MKSNSSKVKKTTIKIYAVVCFVFLALYLLTMTILTVVITHEEQNLFGKWLATTFFDNSNLLNLENCIANSEDDSSDYLGEIDVINSRFWQSRVYRKNVIYDVSNQTQVLSSGTYVNMPTDDGKYYTVMISDYLSRKQINELFFHDGKNAMLGDLKITGYYNGKYVIPKTIKRTLFDSDVYEINIDVSDSTDMEILSFNNSIGGYNFFIDSDGYGPISKKDEKRQTKCMDIINAMIESKYKQIEKRDDFNFENIGLEFVYPEPKFSWIKTIAYKADQIQLPTKTDKWDMGEYIYYQAVIFYPLESAMLKLIVVYILVLLVMMGSAVLLANRLTYVYNQQTALEESRRNLINSAAHELKTPLAIITGYTESIRDNVAQEKNQHYLNMILQESEYMDKMVVDMLVLSKLEAKAIKPDLKECSLSILSNDVISAYKQPIKDKNIKLTTDYDEHDRKCIGDKELIKRVISNFLSNAIRHTPQNGWIKISVKQTLLGLRFEVENQGESIPASQMKNIWDVFHKTDTSRTREEGTGLGLTIARHILQIHGWSYNVQNNFGSVIFSFET